LDGLAAEGVVFDQHFADRPDAAGARHSWRTGRYDLPLPDGSVRSSAAPQADLLQLLGDHGIRTTLVIELRRVGLGDLTQGWNHVSTISHGAGKGLERTLAAVKAALDGCACADRWLLWLDLATLLPPWHLPEEFRGRYFEEEADEREALEPLTDVRPGP